MLLIHELQYMFHSIASLTFEQLHHNLLNNKNFWAKINLYQSIGLLTLSQVLKTIPVYIWSNTPIVLENRAIIKGFTRNEPLLVTANRKSAKDQLDNEYKTISLTSMLDASILYKGGDELRKD